MITTPHLRMLIEAAVADGVGLDDVEDHLIEPAHLPRELHDALWLYARARGECPHRQHIALVSGS